MTIIAIYDVRSRYGKQSLHRPTGGLGTAGGVIGGIVTHTHASNSREERKWRVEGTFVLSI